MSETVAAGIDQERNQYGMTAYQSFIHMTRYSRWVPELGRRETWPETVQRYVDFFASEFGDRHPSVVEALYGEIRDAILYQKVMPSMRAMMTAGPALKRTSVAGYNCSYLAVNSKESFSEALYVLMCGTGVGFSCERQEISNLPVVPDKFSLDPEWLVVEDSKEGWATAFKELIESLYSGRTRRVDYSLVRPAGEKLKTFGGRASGPEPLQKLFQFVKDLFTGPAAGRKLTSIEVHDIMCMIGEIVVVGGVRRSALISLSNLSDQRMRDAKSGKWWEHAAHRSLANNSVAYTEKPSATVFMEEWLSLVKSQSGERGIFNRVAAQNQAAKYGRRSADIAYGCNPCCVSGETLILTDQGNVPIVDRVGLPTTIWNGESWEQVVPYAAGVADLYRVTLTNGVHLDCTANHRWVSGGKFVTTDSLVGGMKLDKFPMPVVTGDTSADPATDAYSQGFYSGDGSTDLTHSWLYSPKYSCSDRLIGVCTVDGQRDRKRWVHGPMLPKNFVPVNSSLDYKLNWLAGLLDADGVVTRDKNGSGLQLTSVDRDFLGRVLLLLTTLGIRAGVYRMHPAREVLMPDGRGGQKIYQCQAAYRLLINNTDAAHLVSLGIRFNRLVHDGRSPQRDARRFVKIESVEPLNVTEMTYCFTEPKTSRGTFNGIVTGNSEILLRDKQFCNLTEVVIRASDDLDSIRSKVRLATILGTLQAGLTDFGFLSEEWIKNTVEEALLGVSLTGIMDNPYTSGTYGLVQLGAFLDEIREYAVEVNKEWAGYLGINPAAAITCVKPSGTVSQLCDTSSGIHARHNSYYIRTVRLDKKDPVYSLLTDLGFPMEDDVMRPDSTAVVSFPQVSPEGAVTRNDMTALEQLELWLLYQRHWCEHKPSVTISVKDHEWLEVGAWVFEHFDEVCGVSFLPHSDHTYQQAPYQDMTAESLAEWVRAHPSPEIDWSRLPEFEKDDQTVAMQTLACVAGVCEI